MSSFLSWLTSPAERKSIPQQVVTDRVVPMRFFDDTTPLRNSIVAWTFRFNDVLDHDKLHNAVSKLLNIPSWRQLGARLRLDKSGRLELHIPKEFTSERPGVRFSHDHYPMNIGDHSLASRLPKPMTTPTLQTGASEFKSLAARPGAPCTIEEFLHSDEPQLSMHVVTFADASLVSLLFPHTMTDAIGIANLVAAISLVLAGRENEVKHLREPTDDVLADIGTSSDKEMREAYDLAKWKLTGFSGLKFGLNFVWDMFWEPPMKNHIVYLPSHLMEKLRAAAEMDLVKDLSDDKPQFISTGDILSAWGSSMILSSNSRPRPAIIMNVLNMRGRLASVFKSEETFVQNLAFNTTALLSATESMTLDIGHIALKVRRALIQQTTEPQLRAIVEESRTSYTSTGNPPLFGDANARMIVVTNWDKAKIFDAVDFSPAIRKQGNSNPERKVPPGHLICHHAESLKQKLPVRHFLNIVGKDLEGSYWISGYMMHTTWQKILASLESMQKSDL